MAAISSRLSWHTPPGLPTAAVGTGPSESLAPARAPAPEGKATGKKRTFPSMIVLPLAERVMKILGKCYTTRGYPFGEKFPGKPGCFPGGRGAMLGRRYLPGRTSASSAVPPCLPPFPGWPQAKLEPENNMSRLRPQTYLSPLQCYKKHLN